MGIRPLWGLVFEIRRLAISPHLPPWLSQWTFLWPFIIDFAWLAALPILFLLLYLTAATLRVSRRQRSLAAVLALLQTVSVLISLWTRWKRNTNANWHNVALARSLLRDVGLMDWLSVREVASLTADLCAEFLPNVPIRHYDTSLLAHARRLPWGCFLS